MAREVLILGATSAIAQELGKLLAAGGDRLLLVGRDAEKLEIVADDLRVRGAATVETLAADLDRLEGHPAIFDRAGACLPNLDTIVLAYGTLGDQQRCERDVDEATALLLNNFTGPVALLTPLANDLERRGRGAIVVIGSVAGDRGRPSNYVYGAAKGGLALFLQGLRGRLQSSGVQVLTVKPGFVDTPMTAHLEKNILFATPQAVARGIFRAMRRGKDVVYVPWFWRPVMLLIRLVPERVFKRMTI